MLISDAEELVGVAEDDEENAAPPQFVTEASQMIRFMVRLFISS